MRQHDNKYFVLEEVFSSGHESQDGLYLLEAASEEVVRLNWQHRYGISTLYNDAETYDGNIYSMNDILEITKEDAKVLKKYLMRFDIDNSLKECDECCGIFNDNQGAPYKHEPSRWMCQDCLDRKMEEE